MTPPQWDSLYVDTGCSTTCPYSGIHPCKYQPNPGVQLEDLDITLLRFIIDKLFPGITALENIRKLRNELDHLGTVDVSDVEFQNMWFSARGAILQIARTLAAPFLTEIQKEIDELETKSLDEDEHERGDQIVKHLKDVSDEVTDVKHKVESVESKVDSVSNKIDAISKTVTETVFQRRIETIREDVLQRRIVNTKCVLESHRKKTKTSFSKAEKAAYERLQTEHLVTISGRAGSDKTSSGKQLLIEYCDQHREDNGTSTYTPVIISNSADFDLIDCRDRLIIFIDDPLGRSNIDNVALRRWETHFDNLLSFCTEGNARIIIGVTSNITSSLKEKHRNSYLFSEENIIDLSPEHKLTPTEKLQDDGRKHNVSMCEDEGVQQSKDSSSDDNETFETETDTPNSIPISVLPENSISESFGSRNWSTQILKRDISALKDKAPIQFITYLLLPIEGGKINLDCIDEDKLRKLNEEVGSNYRISDIRDCVYHNRSTMHIERDHAHTEKGGMQEMRYQFTDQKFLEASVSLFFDSYPEYFLNFCSYHVIQEFVRPSGYEPMPGETCVNVPPEYHTLLAKRVIENGLHCICSYRGVHVASFVEVFLDEIEPTFINVTGNNRFSRYNDTISELIGSPITDLGLHFCKAVCTRYMHNGQKRLRFMHTVAKNDKPQICLDSFLIALNYLLQKERTDDVEELITSSELDLNHEYTYRSKENNKEMVPILYAAEQELKHLVLYWSKRSGTLYKRDRLCLLLDKCCQYDWRDVYEVLLQNKENSKYERVFSPKNVYSNASGGIGRQILEYFLRKDIDNLVDKSGNTLLHYCSQYGLTTEVVQILGSNCKIANKQNKTGQTAAHLAAYSKNKDIVKELLHYNADISRKDDNGYTVLHHCAAYGWDDIIQQYVTNKIKNKKTLPSLKNEDGFSPVHLAVYFGNQKVVKILLKAGANLQHKKYSCVAIALFRLLGEGTEVISFKHCKFDTEPCAENCINLVEFIIQQKSSMTEDLWKPLGKSECTIIHYCILVGITPKVTTFLSHVVTQYPDAAHARNKTRLPTALHLAAYVGRYDLFVLLYEAGVRVAEKDLSIKKTLMLGVENAGRSLFNHADRWFLKNLELQFLFRFNKKCQYDQILAFYANTKLRRRTKIVLPD